MSLQPYLYSPLNEAYQEIRLLTIHPGVYNAPLRLFLQTVCFSKDSILKFEALSYTWGLAGNPAEVVIESDHSTGTIAITRNLAEALPYLRHIDEVRVIWIDAICVNQQDLAERSSQVKRMADIYSSALRVIVWLGPESDNSTLAIECCQKVSTWIAVDWGQQTISLLSHESRAQWVRASTFFSFNRKECKAISDLVNRDWFKRLWIWQEVNLAQNAVVMCGHYILPWSQIRNMAYVLYWKRWPRSKPLELIDEQHKKLLYSLCHGPGAAKLQELLENTKHCQCSDPRDRIFALLSLLHEQEQNIKVQPDYSKPLAEVYQEFCQNYIKEQKHLRILSATEIQDGHLTSPSWVPDWSRPRLTTPFGKVRASGSSPASFTFKSDGHVRVLGRTIGIIQTSEAFMLPVPGPYFSRVDKLVTELRRIIRICHIKDVVLKDDEMLFYLFQILCGNRFAEVYSPPRLNFPSLQNAKQLLEDLLPEVTEPSRWIKSTRAASFVKQALDTCCHRSMFKCFDGTIGLAPKTAITGHKVVALLGFDSAMVLRPVGGDCYRPVGEAMYSGPMDGEAFLGLLPKWFELERRHYEAHDGNIWGFFDMEKHEFSTEDPRLKDIPLPAGWKRRTRPDSPEVRFVNEETGEDTWQDPRFTAESLRSRGIALEEFELV